MNEERTRDVYRFTLLKKGIRPEVLNALVHLAIKETELMFGCAKRKLETNCYISPTKMVCTIEGGTECGEHLARLLSGILIKQVGDDGFFIRRSERQFHVSKRPSG
jgi:hypothetical protein